jgi:hypothetical protein
MGATIGDTSYESVWHEYVSSQLARMAQRCTDLDARADAIMAELSALSRRVARLEVAAHGSPPTDDDDGYRIN